MPNSTHHLTHSFHTEERGPETLPIKLYQCKVFFPSLSLFINERRSFGQEAAIFGLALGQLRLPPLLFWGLLAPCAAQIRIPPRGRVEEHLPARWRPFPHGPVKIALALASCSRLGRPPPRPWWPWTGDLETASVPVPFHPLHTHTCRPPPLGKKIFRVWKEKLM